ncbi:hypothetical protein BC832DRAFT_542544 [Gaertneriomyces semiglobifer]|nr:hypothetical protein BC832DRAFT_542544 [Gaertneriomyces semiglobifer]
MEGVSLVRGIASSLEYDAVHMVGLDLWREQGNRGGHDHIICAELHPINGTADSAVRLSNCILRARPRALPTFPSHTHASYYAYTTSTSHFPSRRASYEYPPPPHIQYEGMGDSSWANRPHLPGFNALYPPPPHPHGAPPAHGHPGGSVITSTQYLEPEDMDFERRRSLASTSEMSESSVGEGLAKLKKRPGADDFGSREEKLAHKRKMNAEAARRCRERKAARISSLEEQVASLEQRNAELVLQNTVLENQCRSLKVKEVQYLEQVAAMERRLRLSEDLRREIEDVKEQLVKERKKEEVVTATKGREPSGSVPETVADNDDITPVAFIIYASDNSDFRKFDFHTGNVNRRTEALKDTMRFDDAVQMAHVLYRQSNVKPGSAMDLDHRW